MNYILEIKAFYDWLEVNQLPTSAIALWHSLMHMANKTGWKDNFTVAIVVLEIKTGLKKQAILNARNILKTHALISFESRSGNQSAVYKINSLCGESFKSPQSDTQGHTQGHTQEHTQGHTQEHTINKLNETKQNKIDYQLIADMYNATCVSFPKCKTLSDNRKKAIKARFNTGYNLNDFKKLFELSETSDFLKGNNNRNWTATFDWLIKDNNMAKVIDGNYENKGGYKDESNSRRCNENSKGYGENGQFKTFEEYNQYRLKAIEERRTRGEISGDIDCDF